MKFPVRRCRIAALVMALLAPVTICSAASFLPETTESTYTAQMVSLVADHRNAPNLMEEPLPVETTDIAQLHAETLPETLLPDLHGETWLEEEVRPDFGITLNTTQLYTQADTQSQALRQLEAGAILELTSDAGPLWYQVTCGELTGYVPADHILPNVCPNATLEKVLDEENLFARVTIPTLPLREAAASEGETLLDLELGQVVRVLQRDEEWSYVEYDGQLGWLLTEYLALGAEKPQWMLDQEAAQRQAFTDELLALAREYMGYPYRYGKAGPNSFDCSGFTTYVFKEMGISLARSSNDQRLKSGTPVEGELLPGDLVFFSRSSARAATHVGIYLGDGQFIHASSGKCGVTINNLTDPWYVDTYVGANRVY